MTRKYIEPLSDFMGTLDSLVSELLLLKRTVGGDVKVGFDGGHNNVQVYYEEPPAVAIELPMKLSAAKSDQLAQEIGAVLTRLGIDSQRVIVKMPEKTATRVGK